MSSLNVIINELDHIIGSLDAPVVLIEYLDFQCAYCGRAEPVIEKIISEYEADICFVVRHYPLTEIHNYAFVSALAAEAAGLQGKFWEMHHALFDNQEFLSEVAIDIIAKEIGLIMKLFKDDMQRPELGEKIHRDFKGGVRSGIEQTPGLFINGRHYEGGISFEELSPIVMALIGEQYISSV